MCVILRKNKIKHCDDGFWLQPKEKKAIECIIDGGNGDVNVVKYRQNNGKGEKVFNDKEKLSL